MPLTRDKRAPLTGVVRLPGQDPAPEGRPRRRPDIGHVFGFGIIGLVALCAIAAPLLAPYNPDATNPAAKLLPVLTEGHLLGTDELGRDMLSRLIFGARFALFVAVVPTIISMILGGVLGLVAGYAGGWFDALIMRVFDVMFSFPGILLALGIGAALGAGTTSMIIAMVAVTLPETGRVVRGAVLGVKAEPYVESAATLGLGHAKIIARHVAPNVLSPAIVLGALQTGNNVILAASLSFLGLGAQPPTADWGGMLSGGKSALLAAPHVATLPGIAIVLLAVGFNLAGDALRDKFDPRSAVRRPGLFGGAR